MTLGEKRRLFTHLLAKLVLEAEEGLGYWVQLEEVKRGDVQAAWNAEHCRQCGESQGSPLHLSRPAHHAFRPIGIRRSLHCLGLAADLSLFREAEGGQLAYLETTEDHRPLGEWWEQQHELCRWGGRFGDGNHYSIEHEGRK